MSAREFAEWQAFDQLDPIGTGRLEYYLAQLSALVVNTSAHVARRSFTLEDFLLRFEPKRSKPVSELVAAFKALGHRLKARWHD